MIKRNQKRLGTAVLEQVKLEEGILGDVKKRPGVAISEQVKETSITKPNVITVLEDEQSDNLDDEHPNITFTENTIEAAVLEEGQLDNLDDEHLNDTFTENSTAATVLEDGQFFMELDAVVVDLNSDFYLSNEYDFFTTKIGKRGNFETAR